jgi:ribosome maturation factor RimP
MDMTEEIWKLAESCLADSSQFIVDIKVSTKGQQKVLLLLDGDNGITIEDCAEVNRKVSKAMDENDLMKDRYFLEVSSPGLDHPLTLNRQFKKNVGRKIKVLTNDSTIEGLLQQVTEEGISVLELSEKKDQDNGEKEIPFSVINKAFILVSFK